MLASKKATYTEVERRFKYSINSVNAYTHKSVEWPDLKPNWLSVVQRYSSSLCKITFSNTLEIVLDKAIGLYYLMTLMCKINYSLLLW